MAHTGRFERDPHGLGGGKVRNRVRSAADAVGSRASPGDFLARLWTLFGPPDQVGDVGFEYRLRDRETGLPFTAYSGASGPAYGGSPRDAAALDPVLDAFDARVDGAPLAECEIEMPAGDGRYRLGARGGVPFEELILAADALDTRLRDARDVLARADADVWDALNLLLDLLRLADLSGSRADADPALAPVLRALWLRAFSAAEEFILAIGRGERGRVGIEAVAEAALPQLEEAAAASGIAPGEYAPRFRALRKIAGPMA